MSHILALPSGMNDYRMRLAKRAAELRDAGLTLRQISARLGRSEGEVSKLVRAGRTTS